MQGDGGGKCAVNAPLLRPCGVEPGRDREDLVPAVLKREEKAPYGTAAALFGSQEGDSRCLRADAVRFEEDAPWDDRRSGKGSAHG